MLRLVYLRAYTHAGGPTAAGKSAFLGRGFLRIRRRRLGGKAVGGKGSSRLCRVSQGDEVDCNCCQFFVNSSLSPILLFRRRLKSVADVLKGIRSRGFLNPGGTLWLGIGVRFVVMVHAVPLFLFVHGMIGFLLICMAFINGFLTRLMSLIVLSSGSCFS